MPVDPHVLSDGGDAPGPNQATTGCSTAEAPAQEVFLDSVHDGPEVISQIGHPSSSQELGRLHTTLDGAREANGQSVLGELATWMVGPLGFEPRTKGFTRPRRFRREWTISSSPDRGATAAGIRGCGTLKPVIKGT